ncbi:MAG: ferrochelatase [Zetaproteobacteria bacterium CG12_big_fil_rev_8_21_14_0_65_55_1124]|nr:MAG: ferrochelatase [Zetaproteobacteria bacterium CG1_02_55_237]PIS19531.1 MAG: ferrochelatase [Zetaproteobacteria bacterium CG08_land_8_20_14_0_20_55_17]PIW42368.1 MAG: ferrochelatase [Zetaproteobacteria bacterium CG12_big_fil_rev_8_21_14_0_65_55_1124]PIY52831.1 MAG: ferrochelatase [Zetaproteobacteria bacterium CG_4_10_14_0_8_um_filter_55_43]PIZ38037.1 MAG: ferrochelatase [Zetaproteobacteria bacterium CG_4_10_14_0_2_um_filter_55_20]PJB79134.1 MAG: ferrochelatase [Zetaproteobacteria bacteri
MAKAHPIGILLTNLGTPDAPDAASLRRYLGEFLWDRRVVDLPRPLWWLILNCVILPFRSPKSAALYRKVWTDEGSPLLAISRKQQESLQAALENTDPETFRVELAMRYGNPSIASGMQALANAGCLRVLVLPLYPQYSSSTTASTLDAVAGALKAGRDMPELRLVRNYHEDPAYIAALANSIREDFAKNGHPEKLLFSFHGIPQRFHQTGDPYPDECRATAELLAAKLKLTNDAWMLTFQSRFGREEWMQPYTDKTLESLAGRGVGSVAIACPGFSADCLETLEEIEHENRAVFIDAGGKSYRYITALNDRDDHILALAGIVKQHCCGWLD